MSAGSVWWGQLGNSLRLLTTVTKNLKDCRSAVLQVPAHLPWKKDFYDAIDTRRAVFSGERRLLRPAWKKEKEPGQFVLDELCSARVRADYYPGQTYADYLASKHDISLNEYYVWITGVHTKSDLAKWVRFVSAYEQAAQSLEKRAVFIIEYDGPVTVPSGIEGILYTVENYDCRVFSLEMTTALQNTKLRNYQAELALSVSGNNPELCYELLAQGEAFLKNPVQVAMEVMASCPTGYPFAAMSEQQIQSAVWEASIVLLFPVLEQFRMRFIEQYATALSFHLPITNSNGDKVTEPCDLEIGSLYYITGGAAHQFEPQDIEALRLCRKVRNLLAHNRALEYEDVTKVLLELK